MEDFKIPKILVVGDWMVDRYVYGKASRISPEGPFIIFDKVNVNDQLGGAGNVCRNLKSIGADVTFIGGCASSKVSLANELFSSIDVKFHSISCEQDYFLIKERLVDETQLLRIDSGEFFSHESSTYEKFEFTIRKIISSFDVVVLSDYAKGFIDRKTVEIVIEHARLNNIAIVCDPKSKDLSVYTGVDYLTPNKREIVESTSFVSFDDDGLKQIRKDLEIKNLIVTLSGDGILLVSENEIVSSKGLNIDVVDVTGAGDTVVAVIAYLVALGVSDNKKLVSISNQSGHCVVQKKGCSTIDKGELLGILGQFERLDEAEDKIVFTNGCFDILHTGHLKLLEFAKGLGNYLLVGLNSDESIKRLKGDSRPVKSQEERKLMLESIKWVSEVVIFDEDTPYELIKQRSPDVIVKGGDYSTEEVVGRELVTDVVIFPFVEGKSSTSLINKMNS
jgi:D-beta-D-heptose 7-phosphate kinase / D-beta-D-heptose 1-phosphate adenosyltransferase